MIYINSSSGILERRFTSVEGASCRLSRLDQALRVHPLRDAFLYRFRLTAIRQQSSVDGFSIDPWVFAAALEGIRHRINQDASSFERGSILDAVRHALMQYQWICNPDEDQYAEILKAKQCIGQFCRPGATITRIGEGCYRWLDNGGNRAPMRAAIIQIWQDNQVLSSPIPITGARALNENVVFTKDEWPIAMLNTISNEADDGLDLLRDMERTWLMARRAIVGRRRNSRAMAAVDLLAASPLLSPTRLGALLGMATNNATALLVDLESSGVVIEVTRRAKNRLFGLAGLELLREQTASPKRPQPGRSRGRPKQATIIHDGYSADSGISDARDTEPTLNTSYSPFDYTKLDDALASLDQVLGQTRASLDRISKSIEQD